MHILIVDDHPLVHEILGAVVRHAFDNPDVQTASDLEQAIAVAGGNAKIDLTILDLGLPRCHGVEALKRFKAAHPEILVAVFSADDSRATILAAFGAGAVGYLPKTLPSKVVVDALRLIMSGGFFIPKEVLCSAATGSEQRNSDHAPDFDRTGLTGRQTQILRLLFMGLSNAEIAQRLRITEGTVKQHVHDLLRTLSVASRAQAVAIARKRGFREE